MHTGQLNSKLPLLQDADLQGKVVLLRVDHNVVKKGVIKDPYRIECTFGTLFNIVSRGGKPVLMTHVGRPYDKKSGSFKLDSDADVAPIVDYMQQKLCCKVELVDLGTPAAGQGMVLNKEITDAALSRLKNGQVQMLYLPNTRALIGEEVKGEPRQQLAKQLAALADIYVNDAFGSWQPHASTYDVTRYLPSYAGILLQAELGHLSQVLEPKHPFLGIVAGSKYDTKIGPITALYNQADHIMLGGVVYNTYLCAKYGCSIEGVEQDDIDLARQLVEMDKEQSRVVQLSHIVESNSFARKEGEYRTLRVADLKPGQKLKYVLDVGAESFKEAKVKEVVNNARSIFVNAVMGFTPSFSEGSQALYLALGENKGGRKLFGGGDTLDELKRLAPAVYLRALEDPEYYFFTGGGSVLTALEQKSAYGLEPVQALLK